MNPNNIPLLKGARPELVTGPPSGEPEASIRIDNSSSGLRPRALPGVASDLSISQHMTDRARLSEVGTYITSMVVNSRMIDISPHTQPYGPVASEIRTKHLPRTKGKTGKSCGNPEIFERLC